MNKEKFLSELRQKLSILSKDERDAAMTYYEEYFNDAGSENEQAVITELGPVDKIVNSILKENNYPIEGSKEENKNDNRNYEENENHSSRIDFGTIVLIIIGLIFVSPVVIPLIIGMFGLLIGLLCAGIGIIIAGFAVSAFGFVTLFVSTINGLLILGSGIMLFAVGIFISSIMSSICSIGIPAVIRGFVKLCKLPFQRGGVNI